MKLTKESALIIVADGSEDIELVATADVLQRAGIQVTIAGLSDGASIKCAQKVSLNVDCPLSEVLESTFDAVVLPGGQPASDSLAADPRVGKILKHHEDAGKLLAAICAGPISFESHGIAKGATLTSYPCMKDRLIAAGYKYSDDPVCVCHNIVTSQGPGTALKFALKIAEILAGPEKARSVCKDVLAH